MAIAVTAAFALTACADTDVPSGTDPLASASTIVSAPPTIGPVGCEPGSPSAVLEAGLEVQASASPADDEVWALFTGDGTIATGTPTEVYWRIGGDRALRIILVGPNDRVVPVSPAHPEPHAEWSRPGEPWVSTITFPQPGCWRVYVERARVQGDLWVEVA